MRWYGILVDRWVQSIGRYDYQSRWWSSDRQRRCRWTLGLGIIHPDYPNGLGVVIKIAHGWNAQATWYVARAVLGVLGINLRNPYACTVKRHSGIWHCSREIFGKVEEVKTG